MFTDSDIKTIMDDGDATDIDVLMPIMPVNMTGLEFTKDYTYYFCFRSFARQLPASFDRTGITDYAVLPVQVALAKGYIPDSVHIPSDADKDTVYLHRDMPADTVSVDLYVVISHVTSESLYRYLDVLTFGVMTVDSWNRKVKDNPDMGLKPITIDDFACDMLAAQDAENS